MTDAIRTLLVPVDGSKHAAAAARYADGLARALGARVVLLHAFPESARALLERLGNTAEQAVVSRLSTDAFDRMRKDSATRAYANARSQLSQDAVAIDEELIDGDPAEAVAEYARSADAPAIVMGRRGLGCVREFLVGSVSEGILQRAECPVTVVSDDDVVAPQTYVVPVDGSEASLAAAAHAGTLSRATGVPVHLLHVFPNTPHEIPGVGGSMAELAGVGPFADENFQELGRESAQRAFSSARKRIGESGVAITEVRRGGDAATAITAYSREVAPAEVVMGRRGLSRVERFLVGSVSRRVVHGAYGPVTVVN